TQLGWPSLKFKHLRGEMHYPGLYQANSSLPADLRRSHQTLPMIDVDHWVRHEASQMLFVYGGSDPWGAEQFVPSRNDSYSYTVAGGNHGSKIAGLAPDDKAAATAELLRWAGVGSTTSVQSAESTGALNELDRRDPDLQRRPL